MFTRTKIVVTIGPAVASYEKMIELIHAGMNVARLNFSHGTHEEHERNIANLKRAREETQKPLALMLDMKGPKIRVDKVQGDALSLSPKQRIFLVEKGDGTAFKIPFHPIEAISALRPGMKILFDDGYIIGIVIEVVGQSAEIEIQNAGILKSGKGVNIPGANLPLPAMTKEDLEDLKFGCKLDIDFIAASFIRSADHVLAIREFLSKEGAPHLPVIAKIESTQGIENFDSILEVSDGIMVARGDLGVELDLASVPRLQKMMIRKCCDQAKLVITATQMLESMIVNPRPTRAEVSDVANAIYDGTSAIMLSAETAVGKYPIEAVFCMKQIAKETEKDVLYEGFCNRNAELGSRNISSSVALAAVKTAYGIGAKAIFSMNGDPFIASFRPKMPVFAIASSEKQYHQLGACWGVIPILYSKDQDAKKVFTFVSQFVLSHGFVSSGDIVVVIANALLGRERVANTMIVEIIGDSTKN